MSKQQEETSIDATPALLRQLRSLRLSFEQHVERHDKALAAERPAHLARLKDIEAEAKLVKQIAACLKEVYSASRRPEIFWVFDHYLPSEQAKRKARLAEIDDERRFIASLVKRLRDAEQELADKLEQWSDSGD